MELDAVRPFVDPAGWALLAQLPPYDPTQQLALGTALRATGLDASLVSAALTQSRLRARAAGKFGDLAHDMLFTPDGLEQATRLSVAARHAHRFRAGGATHVADLGCGIGGDSLALAGLGMRVLAVERDPATALVAGVNLRQMPEARVVTGDAFDVDLGDVDAVWADPARRTASGRRLHELADYSPGVDRLLDLRARIPRLGMKLGPGLAHRDIPTDAHAQWLSVDGEVVEADLWFGDLAPEGAGRSAVVVRGPGAGHVLTGAGDPSAPVEQADAGPVEQYLYEPDGAVIRAGLVARVAQDLGGHLVDPTIAYVTTALRADTPFATGFRVVETMPFSLKRLRSHLRERRIGVLEIKKRGSALDPARLRAQLALRGENSATIVLTRIAGSPHVLVVERLTAPGQKEH